MGRGRADRELKTKGEAECTQERKGARAKREKPGGPITEQQEANKKFPCAIQFILYIYMLSSQKNKQTKDSSLFFGGLLLGSPYAFKNTFFKFLFC